MHIFFSWQSDIPTSSKLIRECLEEAASRLNLENQIDEAERDDKVFADDATEREPKIRIDSDTEGVLGSPEIATTIFNKIKNCDLFVADLTFTGKRLENGRKFSNPNVLIELGFAMSLSPNGEKIVLMLDSTSGKKSHLPFDLRNRRFPIEVKDDLETKESVIKKLMGIFQLYLKEKKNRVEPVSSDDSGEKFLQSLFDENRKIWSPEKTTMLWMAIAPSALPVQRLDLYDDGVEVAIVNPPGRNSGWNLSLLDRMFQIEGDRVGRGKEIGQQLRLFDNGSMLLSLDVSKYCRWNDNNESTLHPIPITEIPTAFLRLYRNLVAKLSLKGPFKLGVAYLNAKNTVLRPGHYNSAAFITDPRTFDRQDISLRFWALDDNFSPETVAFSIAKYVYKNFGWKADAIPFYFAEENLFRYE